MPKPRRKPNYPSLLSSGKYSNWKPGANKRVKLPLPSWLDMPYGKPQKYGEGHEMGNLRFNPKAKLDPSQIQDLRWMGKMSRALLQAQRQAAMAGDRGAKKGYFPFIHDTDRMRQMADWAKWQPGQKRPDLYASTIPGWMWQMLDERRANRPRSIP